jgi:Zn-dependent peptidase ImmA (M78 family)
MIGKSSATLSKWERGEQMPEADALEKLAQQLGMPTSWFISIPPSYGDTICFFRSNTSLTKAAQAISNTRLEWLNELSLTLQEWIDWPTVNIPLLGITDHKKITDIEIEQIALECRKWWKLGLGPISDMVLVLENSGIICVREELGYTNMDGSSRWFHTDNRPYVFLAADKANGVRSRFDAAHELGHLVLHTTVSSLDFNKKERYSDIERQAHRFAGAFLLPAESFAAEVTRPSLDTFLALKPRWKVSIGAMISRSKQLGIIDDDYAVRLWKNYSARGWRKGEPLDETIGFEPIRLLPRAINLLLTEGGMTKAGLLSAFGLGARDCEQLCGLPDRFLTQDFSLATLPIRLKSEYSVSTNQSKPADILQFPIKNR